MAQQAVAQPPAIKKLRITSKRSDPNYPEQLQIQDDTYEKWCAIGSDEEEQFLNFYDEEVRAGTLRKLSKQKVEDIRNKKDGASQAIQAVETFLHHADSNRW